MSDATPAEFDAFLGDPYDASSVLSFERSLEWDAASAFPADAVAALNGHGLQRSYIPTDVGGALADISMPAQLMRHIARRDLTAAIGHGKTFLGAVCAWVVGGPAAERMASIVSAGDPVSWGLTEQGRGSDLSATQTTARFGDDGIVVDGGKWPIGNATRGRAMTVLARTEDRPGPRALSLVLVDKTEVDLGTISYVPRLRTHGIRGADISGVDFRGTTTSSDSLIGQRGQGLEVVLKSLQLTRTLCSALSLGGADQAIELALTRGASPGLERAVPDLLIAEAVAYAGVRHLHTVPEEMALESAVVKYLVPDAADTIYREVADAFGGDAFTVGSTGASRFQKAARDNRVVGIFDGNSVVNLNVMINEFPAMVRPGDTAPVEQLVADLAYPPPRQGLDFARLRLMTRQGSSLLRALPALVETLDDGNLPAETMVAARALVAEAAVTVGDAASLARAARPPAEQFVLAERFARLFGAAACIAVFLANRDRPMTPLWRDGLWLRAAIARSCGRLGIAGADAAAAKELVGVAAGMSADGDPVTILPGWWAPGVWHA